jgi:hypothetical protein
MAACCSHSAWLHVSCYAHVALVAGCLCATVVHVECLLSLCHSAARWQNATQVQCDTAVLVPGLVGSKVREHSYTREPILPRLHPSVGPLQFAPHALQPIVRATRRGAARRCAALHCRLSRSRRFTNTARRSHSSPLALPMAATRAESCASRRQPRHCACTALHCSLSSPQCKLTSACCGSYTWGWNAEAQLGHSDGKAAVYVPTPVAFRRSSDSEAL